MPIENNTYGYPSVSTSLIVSKLIDAPWLTFGKIRANYAQVGNDIDPYRTNPNFVLQSPFNGVGQAVANTTLNNADLKAERTSSFEVGAEVNLFKSRVGIDVSYYDKKTEDLLTPVNVSNALGITNKFANAGSIGNKGVELLLTLKPVQTEDFEWGISVNWSKNRNTVIELANGLENLQLGVTGGRGGVSINATPGEPYGTIRGSNFVFHENGGRIIQDDGSYLRSDTNNEVIGNIQADWNGGIKNSLSYKNLKFSFLVDAQIGGDLFSSDLWYGSATGIYENSVGLNNLGNPVRDPVSEGGGILLEGVDVNGAPNTVRGNLDRLANVTGYLSAPNALHVYDASFVKLREMALSYSLSDKLLKNLPFTQVTGTLTGRNLWIIHKNLPYSDPEAGLSSGNIQGFQSGVMPTLREFGFSLNLQF